MAIQRPRPVVEQVNEILRQWIRDRHFAAGARLPSEIELAERLDVSRATVRSALARLAAEGIVIRRQGAGTFVNDRAIAVNTSMGGMLDYSRLISSSGLAPTIRTLATGTRPASQAERDRLNLGPEGTVLALERLFLADERPAILAQNCIPTDLLGRREMSPRVDRPLHEFLRETAAVELSYAIYEVAATLADGDAVQRLGGPAGRPLVRLESTFFDHKSRPLATGISLVDHDVLRLRLVQAWA